MGLQPPKANPETTDQDAAMREMWAVFLASDPGPEFKPWDEMDALERAVMLAAAKGVFNRGR